jgi:hypothetical protein
VETTSDDKSAAGEWIPVRRLCDRVLEELPDLAGSSTERIRHDLPVYTRVPLREHLAAVAQQQGNRVQALAGRRSLGGEELEQAARLARRRARQGIPVDTLIGAYHVGDQELWRRLSADAQDAFTLLPDVASLMLESLHAISTRLASAHAEVTRTMEGQRITLSHRLLGLLVDDDLGAEAAHLAGSLGFDLRQPFLAVAGGVDEPDDLAAHLESQLDIHVRSAHANRSDGVLVLLQGCDRFAVRRAMTKHRRAPRVGIGVPGAGIRGAAQSLSTARLALALASFSAPVADFTDSWPQACVQAQAGMFPSLLEHAVETADAQPHLAHTVTAFAAADMSVARTAASMHLHANTVTYRLERWAALTGWSPRTFDGLTKSLAACRLARPSDERDTSRRAAQGVAQGVARKVAEALNPLA